jgi:hypothetical protein
MKCSDLKGRFEVVVWSIFCGLYALVMDEWLGKVIENSGKEKCANQLNY